MSEIKHPLIYGKEYRLFRSGKFVGTAFWTEDETIGDSFLKPVVTESGMLINEVWLADHWELND